MTLNNSEGKAVSAERIQSAMAVFMAPTDEMAVQIARAHEMLNLVGARIEANPFHLQKLTM